MLRLKDFELLEADGKNYVYDCYYRNGLTIYQDDENHLYNIIEYDYGTNEFGDIVYSDYSLQNTLQQFQEIEG